jgi:SpoVK/Ycf46/Vps4 family AAA+-type ATPase
MRQMHTALKRAVAAGALLAAACAIPGLSALAQDATTSTTTTSTTTSTSTTRVRVPRTTATPEMIDEAVRRSKARHNNYLSTGKPEQWGSEEPFFATK